MAKRLAGMTEAFVVVVVGYPRSPMYIRVLVRGRQEGKSERLEGLRLLALKTDEGTLSQGMQVTSRSWSRPGNGLSPGASRSNPALWTA